MKPLTDSPLTFGLDGQGPVAEYRAINLQYTITMRGHAGKIEHLIPIVDQSERAPAAKLSLPAAPHG